LGKIFHLLRLMRPANIVTSVADVLAGIAIAGYVIGPQPSFLPIILLCLSTIGLYGGGIVFNDVFDADLDSIERPERAIPSGKVKIIEAIILGSFLLIMGIAIAFLYSIVSGVIAFLIALCALIYNKYSKHHPFIGPLNMGICRGLNLLLGISVLSYALNNFYFIALVPLIFIFSITMISQGEVHGFNKNKLFLGAFLYSIVIGVLLYFAWSSAKNSIPVLFILAFAWMIFKPLFKAIVEPIGKNIGLAVKAGVISLILMDAAWAAIFGSLPFAIFITFLLPLSIWLSKRFAVT
jgi:hypothetical protein